MDRDKINVYKSEETDCCDGCGHRRLKGVYSLHVPYATSIVNVCDDCKEKLMNALKSE
ncbi:hypothetical protein [Bacillus velezensis]|uniref:hypothetical protein n=1 Tax=Bacillus velezensis TaxID=492670 RepID=UPI0012FD3F8C|nr:hypothetical protein [Bacillus velezensis]